jgi:hypothetical protein
MNQPESRDKMRGNMSSSHGNELLWLIGHQAIRRLCTFQQIARWPPETVPGGSLTLVSWHGTIDLLETHIDD